MSEILTGIKFSPDFGQLSRIGRRGIKKWCEIEIRKARTREPQPQCRAHELSIAVRYLRERPKYEFMFRIAERMLAQPLHDLAARVSSDRTLAQSRQQSPLRGDSRVARSLWRSVTRTVVCSVTRPVARHVSRTITRHVSCSVTRSAACAARSRVSHAITRNVAYIVAPPVSRTIAQTVARSNTRSVARRVSGTITGTVSHTAGRIVARCVEPGGGDLLAASVPSVSRTITGTVSHIVARTVAKRVRPNDAGLSGTSVHSVRCVGGDALRASARNVRYVSARVLAASARSVRSVNACSRRLELFLHRARRASARPAPAGGEPPQARWRSADRSPGRRDIRASPRCSAGLARRARRERNARGCRTGRAPAPLQTQLAPAACRYGPRESRPSFPQPRR